MLPFFCKHCILGYWKITKHYLNQKNVFLENLKSTFPNRTAPFCKNTHTFNTIMWRFLQNCKRILDCLVYKNMLVKTGYRNVSVICVQARWRKTYQHVAETRSSTCRRERWIRCDIYTWLEHNITCMLLVKSRYFDTK